MKKLNNKGYLIIEIILASTIAFTIAYYLINLTYKFKDKNEDIYASTNLTSDKITITNNIMNDLDDYYIKLIENKTTDENEISLTLQLQSKKNLKEENRELTINTKNNNIIYKKIGTTDQTIFEKKLQNGYQFGQMSCQRELPSIYQISIPIIATYEKKDTYIRLLLETKEGIYSSSPNGNLYSVPTNLSELNASLAIESTENRIKITNHTNEEQVAIISDKINLYNNKTYQITFTPSDEKVEIFLESSGETTREKLQNEDTFTPKFNADYYIKIKIPANETYTIENIKLTDGTITNQMP